MPRQPDFDLDNTIKGMRSDYLQCRDFGHAWRPYTARWEESERAYESTLRCSRCKAKRVRLIDKRGHQVGSDYDYPDGYLITGMGRLTGDDRAALRLESVLRILPDDADEEVV